MYKQGFKAGTCISHNPARLTAPHLEYKFIWPKPFPGPRNLFLILQWENLCCGITHSTEDSLQDITAAHVYQTKELANLKLTHSSLMSKS